MLLSRLQRNFQIYGIVVRKVYAIAAILPSVDRMLALGGFLICENIINFILIGIVFVQIFSVLPFNVVFGQNKLPFNDGTHP